MKIKEEKLKSFIKWAGGKTQLLENLDNNFPKDLNKTEVNIKRYIEPFLGSGALFFHIIKNIKKYKFEEIVISDINTKLINVYKCLRDDVELLIEILEKLKVEYLSYNSLNEKEEMFYRIRESFNTEKEDIFLQSAEFIFLNKTCFNGLYRENKKGKFNVPFGKTENPGFYVRTKLLEISEMLNLKNSNNENIVKILNEEYFNLTDYIDNSTFIYFDPPYRPITKGGFNDYIKGGFNDENQIQLANFCKEINRQNCKFLLSNSDPKNLDENDEFFDELYSSFHIERVCAKRSINSNGTGRGNVTELLIRNYELDMVLDTDKIDDTFENFLKQLKPTNATLDYFTDFSKALNNVKKISVKLCQLNYLLGKKDLLEAIKEIFEENSKAFEIMNILIAVRDKNILCIDSDGKFMSIDSYLKTPEKIYEYIQQTGLENIFKDKQITNLVDYVFGIEVGLDTNARKNRSGNNMVAIIRKILKDNNIEFREQISSEEFSEVLKLGEDNKIFDFVIEIDSKTFLIETNFYSTSGSKLNEIVRSYIGIANNIKTLKSNSIDFVWITDGQGWESAKNSLKEAYQQIDKLYNLTTIKNFIEEIKNATNESL